MLVLYLMSGSAADVVSISSDDSHDIFTHPTLEEMTSGLENAGTARRALLGSDFEKDQARPLASDSVDLFAEP